MNKTIMWSTGDVTQEKFPRVGVTFSFALRVLGTESASLGMFLLMTKYHPLFRICEYEKGFRGLYYWGWNRRAFRR
jgi:hypothetical protein